MKQEVSIKALRFFALWLAVLFAGLLVLSDPSDASGGVFDVSRMDFTFKDFPSSSRDPLITLPGGRPGQELSLNVGLRVWAFTYMDSRVHSMTDSYDNSRGQFRTVGLEYEVGAHVTESMDIFYYHHSQHVLDSAPPNQGYPLLDAVGFRLNLIKPNHPESLF